MNASTSTIRHAHWSFDVQSQLLYVDGGVARPRRGIMSLLQFLIRHEGQIVTKEDLIAGVWNGREVSDSAIYNRVRALRTTLRDQDGPQRCIHWEYGHGLRFTRPKAPPSISLMVDVAPTRAVFAPGEAGAKREDAPLANPLAGFAGITPITEWQHILGVYHTIYRTPSWPDKIKVGLTMLQRAGDHALVLTSEHGEDPTFGIRQRARYRGSAVFIDGRLFVTEQNSRPPRAICLTTLDAPHAYRPDIMTGLMHGSSWRLGGAPYATRVVWRRVPAEMPLREALDKSGPYPKTVMRSTSKSAGASGLIA